MNMERTLKARFNSIQSQSNDGIVWILGDNY